ncbi:Fur family transcriptional regulator [Hahella sp. NBU794]|uniref:Fur family transcriptional regulator n=1 Tax=Hahella sp. NBU794 TaxID=3422590 RepID=UPI003D6F24C1
MNSQSDKAVFQQHNHASCIHDALITAKKLCKERGLRLTDTRLRVLELIWQSHKPIGAYDILAQFGQEGRNSAPPTVYRALEFLQENGLVHRIASLNAFMGCVCPQEGHQGGFLICKQCKRAQEITEDTLRKQLLSLAQEQNFEVESMTLEISGLCTTCRTAQ